MSDTALPAMKRATPNPLLVIIRLALILLFLLGVLMLHSIRYCFRDEKARLRLGQESARLFFSGCLHIMGIKVTVEGTLPQKSVLLAPNHTTYLDILAVGASCPTFFLSKVAIAHWPVVGFLFRLSKSLTIDRGNVRAVREVNEKITERIATGNSVCVFLEGTTSNGEGVLPFHASLLQSVLDTDGMAVPVAIRWHTQNKHVNIQEDVSYWKKHVIGPHIYRVLGLRGIEVTLQYGEPVHTDTVQERKEFAAILRARILTMLDPDQ